GGKALPAPALFGEHLAAGPRDAVVAAAALSGLLHPPAADPAAPLEAVQQRIQGRHREAHVPARARLDQLRHLVAVAGPVLDQREDHQLGAALLQFAIEDPRVDILHSKILLWTS